MFTAVPKPKHRKQQKAKNNARPTIDRVCTYEGCNCCYAERHEVFYGTKCRQASIEYNMQKDLCHEHHRGPLGPHHNKAYDNQLKQEYQRRFESEYGRDLFVRIFGRNYLEVEQ